MEQANLIQDIRAILPGRDCAGLGGCGYATCDLCAAAIAAGEPANRCPACSQEEVNAILALTGGEAVLAREEKAFLQCAGSAAGKARLKTASSCEAEVKSGFLPAECAYGCVGAGSCVEACTFGALSVTDGTVTVDRDKCTGCGACEKACVQHLFRMVPAKASNFVPCANQDPEDRAIRLCGYSCIGCGDCAEACPQEAISIVDNRAVIDYDKCVGCVSCTVSCRKKIIVDTYHDLTKVKPTVSFVRCRGGWYNHEVYSKAGATTCREAVKMDLPYHCTFGCAGFGDCVEACRFDALSIVQGTAQVDPDKCVGCTACVHVCPQELPIIVPYKGAKMVPCASQDDPEKRRGLCWVCCTGCGDCADNCPDGLIHMENGRAVVDPAPCEDCNICSYVCSYGVITARAMPEFVYLQSKALAAQKGGAAK